MNQNLPAQHADTPAGSAALLAKVAAADRPGGIARAYLEAVREELYARHIAGASGTAIVEDFTAAVDRLLIELFNYAEASHGRRFPRLNQRLTVVPRGGYGRRELNPYSDIDLLFLHDYKPGPYVEIVTEIILHALWDAGLTVGHVVRNAREAVRVAREDLKEQTALLDTRYLAGDQALWQELQALMSEGLLNRNQQKFFKAKLQESRERHARFGDSIYLLQPQIKEGEGGLRDLHTAMWLAKVKYNIDALEDLVHKAVIGQAEFEEVKSARDFLWRVRNSLHFLSRRHSDQLTFEYQEKIAPLLGFAANNGSSPSDALMRAYYERASAIYRFSEGLIARVTENSARGLMRLAGQRQIRPGVVIQQKLLAVAQSDFFKRDPLELIGIYADCQSHGVELSGNTYQLVRDNLALIDNAARADPRLGAALMKILAGRQRVAATLEAMHRAGVLGAIIPEFGVLYARVLHDLYHIYTVDRHSLVAVRELERLRGGEFKAAAPLLTEVARELDFMPLVFLALLLHDIGKGAGHDHHERGAALTTAVCGRLGLDREETDLVVFLVRNHLVMSQVAQKGDLDDEGTVADFARQVGSIDRLKALYLLTFADMKAVAPQVYSNWRDMLLGDLYMRTLKLLEQGDREAVDPARRLAVVKDAVRERLTAAGAPADALGDFLDLMPDRYFLSASEADVPMHFELMHALADRVLVCRHRHFPELEFTEFTVVARDQPGLFSKIAGALTANNLNILSARIITRADGVVLDVFRISHQRGGAAMALEEDRWLRVERDLERVLSGAVEIGALVAAAHHVRTAAGFVRRLPTEVTVDNRSSERFTVVDVFTQDRVGLLFAITNALFLQGCRIHLARISTNADQALDVFHVSDREGVKLTEVERMRALRAALLEALGEKPPDNVSA